LSALRHRARRQMAMGLAGLLWGYVEGMQRAKQEPEYPLRLDFVVIYVVLYEISTQHGTVDGIACVFHINGDAWATTPVKFYSETLSSY
jgi:hypothetical protein